MTWRVEGSYFEACNCEAICPCRSVGGRPGGRSTEGICQFALSWHVAHGHFDDVVLDGLDLVLAGFYIDDEPGCPWQVALFVDRDASPDQHDRLADIFLGRAGGDSRSNFAGAIALVHAVRSARVELDHVVGRWRMGVEGRITVEADEIVPCEETVACGIPGHDRPGQELRARRLFVEDAPLSWDWHGRCAFATSFDYRG